MSVIDFGSSVSLSEFAHSIGTVGKDVTIIGRGEPGIGKSSMLKVLQNVYPDYEVAYIDCTLLDLGDFALPYTEVLSDMKVTKFAPNARFKFHSDKPVIIMLDEIGKAMKAVKNVLLTLMLEHRIGDNYAPKGSIVFGTSNLMSDGVGDMLESHARNRICEIKVRKPDHDEWIEWSLKNDIAPEVIAWVKQFPHALASYTDPSQKDNPYIFNPTKAGQNAVVTPRSLEKASHIAKQRERLGDSLTISLLSGTIGESASRDMQAFFTVVDKLPTWEAVVANPATAKMPDDTVAKCILVFSAIARVDKDTLSKWLTYAKRMDMEWQALFATSVMKSNKQSFVVQNGDFKDWALKNQWLF
jgi:ATPase family associated with various cellular activities (AAA)